MILVIMNIGYYWYWDELQKKQKHITYLKIYRAKQNNEKMRGDGWFKYVSKWRMHTFLHVRLLVILILNLEVIRESGGMMF